MVYKPFNRRILMLGVVPTFCSILLLIIGFCWIQQNQIETTNKHFISLVESTFWAEPANGELANRLESLKPLLYIEPIANFSIIDEQKQVLNQVGLPVSVASINEIPLQNSGRSVKTVKNGFFVSIPFEHSQQKLWLLSQVKTATINEGAYQGFILVTLISALSLIALIVAWQRLNLAISQPLKDIVHQLRSSVKNANSMELSVPQNSPYIELVNTINELLLSQHYAKDEMQNYVEQSTRELRETLETVEIQNIELDIARKNALQASRAKSEFLANTSHELRTPLNGILGFASLLLKTGLSDQQRDYLTTIEHSAQGLLTVINDILDFSKLETGQLSLEYKPIFVRELVEEVFAMFAPQAHEKNIHLLAVVNQNVPRNLLGDPQRIKQVLTNIISNAIKFSARGNVIVRCNTLGELDSQVEIKFSVTDNGIGLTEQQQDNLFKAFSKVDNSDSRLQGGTGLGLAIAKGLVDKMQGDIGVESEIRSGSTFWFTVKFGVDNQRMSQSPLTNSLHGVNALVYDANQHGRAEITHLLDGWGAQWTEENFIEDIQDSANRSSNKIDLLILDAYTNANKFDKQNLLKHLQTLNSKLHSPMILLAPPAIQRTIQQDIIGLNTIIVMRPINHTVLHQSICSLLSITDVQNSQTESKNLKPPAKNEKVKILVVDDNPANLKLVCEFLKPLNTITTAVSSGYEALEKTEQEKFDLILMDVQMPGMDGLETTQMIRGKESTERTPIVALTAHAVAEQKTKLLLSGMDDFLSKPVSDEDLVRIIDRWVNQQQTAETTVESSEKDNSAREQELAINSEKLLQSSEASVFNWSESLQLAKNNPGLATDMLRMLLESLDETKQQLVTKLQQSEFVELYEINHKFHGGCCYCGVPALRQASKSLEIALHKKEYEQAPELTNTVVEEIERLKLWAEEHDIEALFAD